MNILILGASGRTGQQLILQALILGHTVTAVVRKPEQFTISYDRLRVIPGDALKSGSLVNLMAGQDVIVSALGTGFTNSLRPMTFHADTARNILTQMKIHQVRRFVGITSVGVVHDPTTPLWYRMIVQPLLRHKYEDMRQMEKVVEDNGLDWTIIRPVQLNNGPLTQTYRVGMEGNLKDGGVISRADVADYSLRHIKDANTFKRAIALSY